jgi:putative tryptophan/tyrosine transport system substrate-binding protein
MKRRQFIAGLGSTAVWSAAANAQQSERMRRIGVLMGRDENDPEVKTIIFVFTQALGELGWIEGRSLRIDLRWGAGDLGRLDTHARKLVSLAPAVIVADAGAATRAAQRATQTIPIVYLVGGDPVVVGLVRDIARPEGNVPR